MRDEDRAAFRDGVRDHDGGIYTAVEAVFADRAAAKAKYGHIASWDTSAITIMRCLFTNRADFNEDISRWDVSNVKNMDFMFDGATSFNGDLSRWDVSNVKDMGYMFYNATSFNGDLSLWAVGQVKDMAGMFCGATSFDRELGGAWATSTAYKFSMFNNSPGSIAGKANDANGTPQ